jgi:serine/threonine protein kinase
MPLEPGQLLCDRYSIVRVLTSGGMGAVYEARDGHLDDAVCAVKEMHQQLLGTDDEQMIMRRFQEEKAILARLKHPAIPNVRDFFLQNRLCYIVMDYIHGANMEQQLQDSVQLLKGPLATSPLVKDMIQVLDALI